MKAGVVRVSQSGDEVYFRERCYILEITTPATDPTVTIARARVVAGETTVLHRLRGVDERCLMVLGTGEMQIGQGGTWMEVGPGDVVMIPAGTPQRIRNTGSMDLVFHCICSPPFTEACYEHLE